jgi:anti-anti-sigma factor
VRRPSAGHRAEESPESHGAAPVSNRSNVGKRRATMFDVEKSGTTAIVHVRSDIDVLTSEKFRDAVVSAERDAERIAISLLECGYLDSTGLTVLIAAQRRLGNRLSIVLSEDGNVRKIIDIASLAQFLRIVPSLEFAVGAPAR